MGFKSVFRLHLQHHNLTHLQMNAIERHFYRRQHDVSCGSLQVPPDLLASLLSGTPAWAAARDFCLPDQLLCVTLRCLFVQCRSA